MSEKRIKTGGAKKVRGLFWLTLGVGLLVLVWHQMQFMMPVAVNSLIIVAALLILLGGFLIQKGQAERALMLAAAAEISTTPPTETVSAMNETYPPEPPSLPMSESEAIPESPAPTVVSNFSFRQHWRAILWGSTLKMHFTRYIAGGMVFGLLAALGNHKWDLLAACIVTAPFAALFALFLAIAGRIASVIFEDMALVVVGLIGIVVWPFVLCGDPLLWMLRQKYPRIVPVQKFGFFNFKAIIFVLDPARIASIP